MYTDRPWHNPCFRWRLRLLMRCAMDMVLISLSAMVAIAGFFGKDVSFYMAGT